MQHSIACGLRKSLRLDHDTFGLRGIVFIKLAAVSLLGFALWASVPVRDIGAESITPHSAIGPELRGGAWLQKHYALNKRLKERNIDLVFIGDSITQAWETVGKPVWDKFYRRRHAVNLGIEGDHTQNVLWRLDHGNIAGISPKLVVLMIGTNNAGENTPEEIADGVKMIVDTIRQKLPTTKVLVLGIFPYGPDAQSKRRQVNERANAIIAKLHNGKRVYYLDIGKNFLRRDGTLSRNVMPDFLHLSRYGYQIWAESIEPTVAKLMGER